MSWSDNLDLQLILQQTSGVLNLLTLADVTPRSQYESYMFFLWADALELRLEADLLFGGVGLGAHCNGDFNRRRLPPSSVDQTANGRVDEGNAACRPKWVRPCHVATSGVLVPQVLNFHQFKVSGVQASPFSRLKRAFFLNAMEIVLP